MKGEVLFYSHLQMGKWRQGEAKKSLRLIQLQAVRSRLDSRVSVQSQHS